ncbi:glucose import [Tritrichomonas musculus]|uniref:Glucose import n=1 Tax=Tritrichomonas musculus TaxID=1915356 RepID=A0ABR2HH61_9EUKA
MGFDKNSALILILLSLPFQFNLITDSFDLFTAEITKEWKSGRVLTYYENYFCKKITFYVALVSAVSFVFIYYKVRKMRLIISISFFLNAVVWLLYLASNDNNIYLFYIIRGIQGVFLSIFQMSHVIYVLHFASSEIKCFCGCCFQVAMFTGLFFLNLIFFCVSWKAVAAILAVQSIIFGGLIWIVPEMHIKPKSITKESVFQKNHIKPLLVMMLIMFLQQLTGIGTLLGQLASMLSGVGLDLESHLQSCLFDFVGALSTMIAAFITDSIGTRYMWSFSSVGLCIGLVIYAVTLKIETEKWVGTLGIFVYFLFYGLGEGPIPWFLSGTLFPEEVRLETAAITICENLFLSPILDLLWNTLNKNAGQFGSILFSSIACILAIFLGFLIPLESRHESDGINVL